LTEATKYGALCLDGTPGAYYFKAGSGEVHILEALHCLYMTYKMVTLRALQNGTFIIKAEGGVSLWRIAMRDP